MASVLIIDDDQSFCKLLSAMVKDLGHEARVVFTLTGGLQTASSGAFDVVFLDVQMPDGNGLDALPKIRLTPSSPEVIIITGSGDPDGAELAIKSGAWDYVQKPSTLENMTLPLIRALQYREERKIGNQSLSLSREGIVGNSPHIKACLERVAEAATTDASVLITGETGTGKELFALAMHRNSPRANKNFVVLDCAALPVTLVESMLFGHEKGAFTGAVQAREGLIKQADGGTLFLDEVGELPLSIQKAFLRVLQEHRFRPLGSNREIESDFRLVAATNRDLKRMAGDGSFREDLLFRIKSVNMELPPLREHREDLVELVLYHVGRLCGLYKMEAKGISPDFLETIAAYDWPGNVRELFNVLDGTLSLTRHEHTLYAYHLPMNIRVKAARSWVSGYRDSRGEEKTTTEGNSSNVIPTLQQFRDATEKDYFQKLISITGRDIKKACGLSGLSRARLYQLLKEHNL